MYLCFIAGFNKTDLQVTIYVSKQRFDCRWFLLINYFVCLVKNFAFFFIKLVYLDVCNLKHAIMFWYIFMYPFQQNLLTSFITLSGIQVLLDDLFGNFFNILLHFTFLIFGKYCILHYCVWPLLV